MYRVKVTLNFKTLVKRIKSFVETKNLNFLRFQYAGKFLWELQIFLKALREIDDRIEGRGQTETEENHYGQRWDSKF